MNRRGFLNTMIGGIAASAAVRTWPFRVYSFPSEIVAPDLIPIIGPIPCLGTYTAAGLRVMSIAEFCRMYPKTAKQLGYANGVNPFIDTLDPYTPVAVWGEVMNE